MRCAVKKRGETEKHPTRAVSEVGLCSIQCLLRVLEASAIAFEAGGTWHSDQRLGYLKRSKKMFQEGNDLQILEILEDSQPYHRQNNVR